MQAAANEEICEGGRLDLSVLLPIAMYFMKNLHSSDNLVKFHNLTERSEGRTFGAAAKQNREEFYFAFL